MFQISVVKEYRKDKTKIRIHDDYIGKGNKQIKEMLVSLVINSQRRSIG